MKYVYFAICVLTLALTWRFTSEMARALASSRTPSAPHLASVSGEGQASGTPRAQLVNHASGSDTPNGDAAEQPGSLPAEATTGNLNGLANTPSEDSVASEGDAPSTDSNANSELARIASRPPVRHDAQLHETMVTPGNFQYVGAFRPPHLQQNGTSFAYGGKAIAYRPGGDVSGPDDGHPGSLFLLGHNEQQMVAEISIPRPVNPTVKHADYLPVAEVLQPFSDITDGLLQEMTAGSTEPFHVGGMCVSGEQLHWTMHKYYNVENIDYLSHGRTGLNLQNSIAEGLWHLGPSGSNSPEWNSYKNAGYILEIPESERHWFGGHSLMSGLQISTGLQASSQGPALYSYAPPPPEFPANRAISARPLVWYSMSDPLERHHPADRWAGAAWLTVGDKQAVIVVGRKSLGEFYYGEPRPGDCSQDKGYHGAPYEVEIVFYSPPSLIHVANGKLPAMGLRPWLRWNSASPGGGPNQYFFNSCNQYIGGVAYDRTHNFLYITQVDAARTTDNEWDYLPVIHVFQICP